MSKKIDMVKEIERQLSGYFYKNHPDDKIWWYSDGTVGSLRISFDKKTILDLWDDYPAKFTKEEKELFDKENPYWAQFFSGRSEEKQ